MRAMRTGNLLFLEYERVFTSSGGLRAGLAYYRAILSDIADNKVFSETKLKMPVLAYGAEISLGAAMLEGVKKVAESNYNSAATKAAAEENGLSSTHNSGNFWFLNGVYLSDQSPKSVHLSAQFLRRPCGTSP
jgi:hypothetical protein